MDINFSCNKCGQHLAMDESGAGSVVHCPKCAEILTVPNIPAHGEASVPSPIIAGQTKKCPFCSEQILSDARKCKHCGEFLDASLRSPPPAVISQPKIPIQVPATKTNSAVSVICWIIVVFCVLGLIKFYSTEITSATKSTLVSPTEQLKAIVKLASVDMYFHDNNTSFSFDVSKTESLVSPYVGTISYTCLKPYCHLSVHFAYQEKRWMITEGGKDQGNWERVVNKYYGAP